MCLQDWESSSWHRFPHGISIPTWFVSFVTINFPVNIFNITRIATSFCRTRTYDRPRSVYRHGYVDLLSIGTYPSDNAACAFSFNASTGIYIIYSNHSIVLSSSCPTNTSCMFDTCYTPTRIAICYLNMPIFYASSRSCYASTAFPTDFA